MISIIDNDLKKVHKKQGVYELLDINSPLTMSIKADIVSSIITTMKEKQISVEHAARRAKMTKKQLALIVSGSFHDTPLFRLKRIMHRI